MNLYRLLKIFGKIRSRRVKLLAVFLMHIMHKRILGIYIDPVLGCNYRCRMCYFSDENKRKELHGTIKDEDLSLIAGALFHRALKLQIGCGAEPTLNDNLPRLINLGRKYGIPYISLTTNGRLVDREYLEHMIESGLDEITVSAHGITKETYENLMTKGDYGHFMRLMNDFIAIKEKHPSFTVRLNYTMNEDNMEELGLFGNILGNIPIDVLQLRPIQKIGESAYRNFSLEKIERMYDSIIVPLVSYCSKRGIVCMVPEKNNFTILERQDNANGIFEQLTYCYISPKICWREDFDYKNESYESYCKRHSVGKYIMKEFFSINTKGNKAKDKTIKMNYKIK